MRAGSRNYEQSAKETRYRRQIASIPVECVGVPPRLSSIGSCWDIWEQQLPTSKSTSSWNISRIPGRWSGMRSKQRRSRDHNPLVGKSEGLPKGSSPRFRARTTSPGWSYSSNGRFPVRISERYDTSLEGPSPGLSTYQSSCRQKRIYPMLP